MSQNQEKVTGFYQSRRPELSPFYKLVEKYFDDSEPREGRRAQL